MIRKCGVSVLIIGVACITAAAFFYAEALEERNLKYIRGRIDRIDFAGSKIVLQRSSGSIHLFKDDAVFYVPDDTIVVTDRQRIFNRLRRVGFVDLIKGDHVVIAYYDSAKGALPQTVRIQVLDHDIPVP
jgi:hypothetical protein